MFVPAVVMTSSSGCSRAPMPVTIVSTCSSVSCSWYSSTIAQLGSRRRPASRSAARSGCRRRDVQVLRADLDAERVEELRRRCAISRAGRNTSHACFSVVAPE
jgi:hypothetical protein